MKRMSISLMLLVAFFFSVGCKKMSPEAVKLYAFLKTTESHQKISDFQRTQRTIGCTVTLGAGTRYRITFQRDNIATSAINLRIEKTEVSGEQFLISDGSSDGVVDFATATINGKKTEILTNVGVDSHGLKELWKSRETQWLTEINQALGLP